MRSFGPSSASLLSLGVTPSGSPSAFARSIPSCPSPFLGIRFMRIVFPTAVSPMTVTPLALLPAMRLHGPVTPPLAHDGTPHVLFFPQSEFTLHAVVGSFEHDWVTPNAAPT